MATGAARPRAFVPRQRLRSVTAAGRKIERGEGEKIRRLVQPWQSTAMEMHDRIGAIRFASLFYQEYLSRLRLFVGRTDASGEVEELEEGEEPDAKELLARVQDPGGGTSGWKGAYGRLQFLIGDGYLAATGTDDPEEPEAWEYLSPWELRPLGGDRYQRVYAPGMTPQDLRDLSDDEAAALSAGEVVAYRLWTPHPLYSWMPDSPMLAVLDLCEEWLRLTAALRTQSVSRAAGPGFLYVPEELSPAPPTTEGDENAETDPFREDLHEGMIAPLENPGTSADFVPVVIYGPATIGGVPAKEAIFHLTLRGEDQRRELAEQREKTMRQIAVGVDQPPEMLTGLGDSSHWNAWMAGDQAKQTLGSMAQSLCDDLTSAYFRAACREAGVTAWRDLVVGYDDQHLFVSPDRAKDVREAYRDGAASRAVYLDAIGLTEDDAMPEEEHAEWLAVKLRDPTLIDGEAEAEGASTSGEVDAAPPTEMPTVPPETPEGSMAASLENRILGAAEMAVERCRERAGSVLRGWAKGKCSECYDRVAVTPQGLVASVLGDATVRELTEKSSRELVAGGAEAFQTTVGRWGVSEGDAARLGEMIERHAAASLFDEDPRTLPVQFAGAIRKLRIAGAS